MIWIYLVGTIHVAVCFILIGVVLLQHGKGGDMAATFGGASSQTAFGPRGAATLLSKVTTWSAVIFMITSITLAIGQAPKGTNSVIEGLKNQSASAPTVPVPVRPAPATPAPTAPTGK